MDGAVTATPHGDVTGGGPTGLRIPYLVVPRGASNVMAERGRNWEREAGIWSGRLLLDNNAGHDGWADVYALGLKDPSGDGAKGTDVRAAGVSIVPAELWGINDPDERGITFAVTMHDRWANAAPHEIDIAVDTDVDGDVDRYVIMYDWGILTTGDYSGLMVSLITDDAFNILDVWNADAPLNGSTVLLPALASADLGLAPGTPFQYQVIAWDGFTGLPDITRLSQPIDAYNPFISTGNFKLVEADDTARVKAWFRRAADPRGWLVVTLDDRNGTPQGDIVRVPKP
jgi:hypothetical protein